jgi:hypothetical protein
MICMTTVDPVNLSAQLRCPGQLTKKAAVINMPRRTNLNRQSGFFGSKQTLHMIPVPKEIIEILSSHIQSNCGRAESGWEHAREDEDTVTGDFFGIMRTGWNSTGSFSWRFSYNKFRGRGGKALEKIVGGDGIITIHFTDGLKDIQYYKSLVFQAKKEEGRFDKEQREKMRRYFPDGNIMVIFGAGGYKAYDDDPTGAVRLCDMITNNFLTCKIGIEGLYYDSDTRRLMKRATTLASGVIGEQFLMEIERNLPK